jgi:hypothetical protein
MRFEPLFHFVERKLRAGCGSGVPYLGLREIRETRRLRHQSQMFEKLHHGRLFGLGESFRKRSRAIAQRDPLRGRGQINQRAFQPQHVGFRQVVILAGKQEQFCDLESEGGRVALHPLYHILALSDVEPAVALFRFATDEVDTRSLKLRPYAAHQFLDAAHRHDHRLPGPVDEFVIARPGRRAVGKEKAELFSVIHDFRCAGVPCRACRRSGCGSPGNAVGRKYSRKDLPW